MPGALRPFAWQGVLHLPERFSHTCAHHQTCLRPYSLRRRPYALDCWPLLRSHLCTVRHKAIHGLPNAPTFPPTSYPTYTPTIMPTTLPPRPHGRGWRHRHRGYRHRGYRHGRNRHGRNHHRGYRPRYTPKPLKAGVYFKLNPLDREINSPFAYVYGQGFEGRTFMGPDADQKPDGFGNTHHTVASDR